MGSRYLLRRFELFLDDKCGIVKCGFRFIISSLTDLNQMQRLVFLLYLVFGVSERTFGLRSRRLLRVESLVGGSLVRTELVLLDFYVGTGLDILYGCSLVCGRVLVV